jgi:EAL domain-containing protein (putative c-di-GMP-specific phosphodiesterase class I)
MGDYQALADALNFLGVRIVIDAYGTGYSSQSFVSSINPSVIKVDRELISGIDTNKRKETLLQGIVDYCNYLGIGCVAEGISNAGNWLRHELECILQVSTSADLRNSQLNCRRKSAI